MTNLSFDQLGSRDGNFNMVRILAKQRPGFTVCHINAQSLLPKIDEFRFLFECSGVDAICVSETWFIPEICDNIYKLDGYRIFRSDRVGNAGGVAIYIRNNISCKLICSYNVPGDVECLFIEVNYHDGKMLLGCVYRPDKYIKFDSFIEKLELLSVTYSEVVITGDFNCNLLVNEDLTTNMSSINLSAINTTRPTHFSSTNSTLLDLFFVSNVRNVLHYEQLAVSGFSKHDLIFVSYNIATTYHAQTYSFRDFNNINTLNLKRDLENPTWNQIYNLATVDEQLNFLNNLILQTFDDNVPIKNISVRKRVKPWFTNETKLLIEHRNKMYYMWRRYRTPEYQQEYRLARRAVVSKIKNDKSSYYCNKFNAAVDSKKTWKQIREIGIGKSADHSMVVDVDSLNEDFINIPMLPGQPDFYDQHLQPDTVEFNFHCLNLLDVAESFNAVKSNSVGLDDINPKFIKMILPWIIRFVTHLFNTIITTNVFPMEWKHAKIVPVPKAGNEYRPIAILPYLSKVFEHLLHRQIYKYVNDNNLLTDSQSGFRPQRSCVTALSDVIEDIRSNLDERQLTFLVLLDHSKAFDSVHHSILCRKLKKIFNFSSFAVRLISSYLSNRSQSVSSGGLISHPLQVTKGVPQGSILGPLLYSLYANDLPQQINYTKIQMYADDVQLYISCSKELIIPKIQELNCDLDKIFMWASINGLRLNPKKSKCLIIKKKHMQIDEEINIILGGSKIDIVDTAKNLGVTFNKTLTWSDHINQASGRTYGMLRSLWATQHFTPLKVRILLAKTYLLPALLYASEIFTGCNSKDMRKLNVTFNNIIRYIYGLKRFDHITQYCCRIFNMPFSNYLKFKNVIFIHKIIMTQEPKYLYDRLQFSRSRRGKSITQFRHRDHASECQFFILSIRLWNQLPNNIQTTVNAIRFRKLLVEYFSLYSS